MYAGRGPPSYDVTRPQLELLLGSGFTSRQIAEILDVSRSTVRRRLRKVTRYGLPSQVRCDYGGENVDVSLFMNVLHGMRTRNVLRGQSTHNQRIERFWRDLWCGIIGVYHGLFTFLESKSIIDPANELHIWALHYVYLPRINRDLRVFCRRWNNHGLRTEGFSTPVQLVVRACLQLQNRPLRDIQGIFEGSFNTPELEGGVLPQGPDLPVAQERETPEYHNAEPLWREDIHVPESLLDLNEGHLHQLQSLVDPLDVSRDSMGVDLLQMTMMFLQSVVHP
ncbi:hypothetical protein E1301_Tti023335 [Triplophysa tibetana]|uniref:Integrase core domain-containing protein n=1 Tax=Triplophysa tibetana TaxID=1572043 RepID=A0A5A9PIE5_9TELE|nr:hypothetical protein E1301_Tti023335 [Triplophysa tibetana]